MSYEVTFEFPENKTIETEFKIQVLSNDYKDIKNKPTLNGVIIEGDKTTEDYHLDLKDCDNSSTLFQSLEEVKDLISEHDLDKNSHKDIRDSVTQLRNDVDETINSTLRNIQDELDETAQDLTNKIADVSSDVDTLRSDVDNTINTTIASITEQIDDLREDVDDIVDTNLTEIRQQLQDETVNRENADTQIINKLNNEVSNAIDTLNQNIQAEVNSRSENDILLQNNINIVSNNLTTEITNRENAINALSENVFSDIDLLTNGLNDEISDRSDADSNLQSQIDAIVSAKDVVDVVGSYTDIENYDTTDITDKDVVKVLNDETRGGARTYYRYIISDGIGTFTFIGSEGATYTRSESDSRYVQKTIEINGYPLDTDIILDYTDVGAQKQLIEGNNIQILNNGTINVTGLDTLQSSLQDEISGVQDNLNNYYPITWRVWS